MEDPPFFIRMNMISIGTRKSKLALAYTEKAQKHLGFDTEQILIDSTADLNPKTPIQEMGGKGVFTKEIEKALIEKHIDIAVSYTHLTLPTICSV